MKVIPAAGRLDYVHGHLQGETSKDHWVDVLQKGSLLTSLLVLTMRFTYHYLTVLGKIWDLPTDQENF
jgi:hypothetical protein